MFKCCCSTASSSLFLFAWNAKFIFSVVSTFLGFNSHSYRCVSYRCFCLCIAADKFNRTATTVNMVASAPIVHPRDTISNGCEPVDFITLFRLSNRFLVLPIRSQGIFERNAFAILPPKYCVSDADYRMAKVLTELPILESEMMQKRIWRIRARNSSVVQDSSHCDFILLLFPSRCAHACKIFGI